MQPLDRFKEAVPNHVPGLLVLFDLADAKRRNCHLGHRVVDNDIEEFDLLVHSSVGASGLAERIRGAGWLSMFKTEAVQILDALLCSYHKEEQIEVGWRSTGDRNGITKSAQRTVASTIVRAVRCLYTTLTTANGADRVIDELFEQYSGLPPDTPIRLSDAANIKREKWSCVTGYPSEMPFCPFCEGADFGWDNGDGCIYSGSGVCRTCWAYVHVQDILVQQDHLL